MSKKVKISHDESNVKMAEDRSFINLCAPNGVVPTHRQYRKYWNRHGELYRKLHRIES